jgi:hypothetical protein
MARQIVLFIYELPGRLSSATLTWNTWTKLLQAYQLKDEDTATSKQNVTDIVREIPV